MICTAFPPATGGGATRNLLTARGLVERGWDVTVLTGDRRSSLWDDESPLRSMPDRVHVVRARSLDVDALSRRQTREEMTPMAPRPQRAVHELLRRLALTWILVPDADAPWIPFAAAAGRRLLQRGGYQAMLSSGPPHSAHVVARLLRRRGSRWVVDSQDPWADHPFPVWTSAARRQLDRRLERWVFTAADVVAAATESQTARFRAAYPEHAGRFVTLQGGFDETEFSAVGPERGTRRRIVHLGSLYGARSPATFLAALRRVARDDDRPMAGWEVLLAGYADRASAAAIGEARTDLTLQDVVVYVPRLERRRSIAVMLGADVLLLIADPLAGGRDLVPLKTFEYLRAGRPILALVPEGESARLLARMGGAVIAHPSDVEAITRALRQVLLEPPGAPDPGAIAAFEFGATLTRLDHLLLG